MGAEAVVSAIDFLTGNGPSFPDEQVFLRVAVGGRTLLLPTPDVSDAVHRLGLDRGHPGALHWLLGAWAAPFRYAMDERCAAAFLKQLVRLLHDRRGRDEPAARFQEEVLELPEIEPAGFTPDGADRLDDEGSEIVAFRDGLVAIQTVRGTPAEISIEVWRLSSGEG
jgi:hypothetical protein